MSNSHRSTSNTQEMWTAAVCWRGAFTTQTCRGLAASSQPVTLGRVLLWPDTHWATYAGIRADADRWDMQKRNVWIKRSDSLGASSSFLPLSSAATLLCSCTRLGLRPSRVSSSMPRLWWAGRWMSGSVNVPWMRFTVCGWCPSVSFSSVTGDVLLQRGMTTTETLAVDAVISK